MSYKTAHYPFFGSPGLFFLFVLLIYFAACVKPRLDPAPEPLPDVALTRGVGPEKTFNGYFYACQGPSLNPGVNVELTAAFWDPSQRLRRTIYMDEMQVETFSDSDMVDVGRITIDSIPVERMPWQKTYQRVGKFGIPIYKINWQTEGNREFVPLLVSIEPGFPKWVDGNIAYTVSASQDFKLPAKDIAANADSIFVEIHAQGGIIRKKTGANGVAIFTRHEMAILKQFVSNGVIRWYAANYFHMQKNGHRYLFETASKRSSVIYMTP